MLIIAMVVESSVLVGKIGSNTKVVIEKKIVEILTEVEIGNTEEILIGTFLNEVENTNNDINIASIEKMAIKRGFKRKVSI